MHQQERCVKQITDKKRIAKTNQITATISINDIFSLSYIQIDLHWLLDNDMENRIEKYFF